MLTLFLLSLLVAVVVVGATKCNSRLLALKSAVDYVAPAGSPCYANVCSRGMLPWNIAFNVCQPLRKPASNCTGAVACLSWPGDSASLGAFANVTYTEIGWSDGIVVQAGDGAWLSGDQTAMQLVVWCAAQSEAYPRLTFADPVSLTYYFEWNRTEVCRTK